jgi:hypothetical protein
MNGARRRNPISVMSVPRSQSSVKRQTQPRENSNERSNRYSQPAEASCHRRFQSSRFETNRIADRVLVERIGPSDDIDEAKIELKTLLLPLSHDPVDAIFQFHVGAYHKGKLAASMLASTAFG